MFKENAQIFRAPLALPVQFDGANFVLAQERVNIMRAMGDSAFISMGFLIPAIAVLVPVFLLAARSSLLVAMQVAAPRTEAWAR